VRWSKNETVAIEIHYQTHPKNGDTLHDD